MVVPQGVARVPASELQEQPDVGATAAEVDAGAEAARLDVSVDHPADAESRVALRPMAPADRNFVRKSWLRSYAASAQARIAGRAYWTGHHDLIERLLERASVRVACSSTHAGTIVGFACVGWPSTLHYVYVREEFRRYGVARRLLADLPAGVTYSHRSDMVSALPVPDGWFFSPYAATEAG